MYNLMAYVHQLTVLLILNSHLIQIWLPVGYCESGPSVNLLEFEISWKAINRGCYTVARRYEFYVRVART